MKMYVAATGSSSFSPCAKYVYDSSQHGPSVACSTRGPQLVGMVGEEQSAESIQSLTPDNNTL